MKVEQNSAVTAVVFDLGNVLVGWDSYRALTHRMTLKEWLDLAEAMDFASFNAMADSGVPLDEVIRRASEKDPSYGEVLREYYERFDDSIIGPVPGAAEIVAELKSTGVRLLGLTNWSDETYHFALPKAPAIALLDSVMVSGREGLAKPDPRIFERMIERYDLIPHNTVFIDDSPSNVEAAAALGLVSILFTDADALREQLRRLGVL
ncbi:MAG: HAD family phosphatase [Ancrocorticia sp.]